MPVIPVFGRALPHSCCEQRLRTGCSAQAGADSTAPTASSLVAPTSTRLACVCAAVRRAAGLPGLRACSRQHGQQMAAALALRAAHGHAATGSEGGVHGSARRLAGMLPTARWSMLALTVPAAGGTIRRAAAARSAAADGKLSSYRFALRLTRRSGSIDPDRLCSLHSTQQRRLDSLHSLSHGGGACMGSLVRNGAAAGSTCAERHGGCGRSGI